MAKIFLATCYKGEKTHQVSPPLGILYLSAILKKHGHCVRAVDLRVLRGNPERVLSGIRRFNPDIVGLSANHTELTVAGLIADGIKKYRSTLPIVLGGPATSSSIDTIENISQIDFVIEKEGENSLLSLVEILAENKKPNSIPGLFCRQEGCLATQTEAQPIENLDHLPFPDWEALGFTPYHRAPSHGFIRKNRKYFSVSTSRGCPYGCIFCLNPFGRKFRYRSSLNVVDEIEVLVKKHGIREIHFPDDCFNIKKHRAIEIFNDIRRRGLKISIAFPSGIRGDICDREFLTAAKKAGVYRIPFGIETASPRLQKLIKKNVDLDKVRQAVFETAKLGIITQGFFMIGFPTETDKEINQTIHYARSSGLHLASFNFVNPFPGTELYRQAQKKGIPFEKLSPEDFDFDDPPVSLSEVDPAKLAGIAKAANASFYLNPFRLLRLIAILPRKSQLFGLVAFFFRKSLWNMRKNAKKILKAEQGKTY